MKVFGIGFSKTGTSTLTKALNMLGINTIHFPIDNLTYTDLVTGQYKLRILEKYDGIVEGIAPFYPQFDKQFPNSKFILTIREKNSWIGSISRHLKPFIPSRFEKFRRQGLPFHSMMLFFHAATYGSVFYNEERYSFAYDMHLKNVSDYFKDRSDLLIIDICGGEGWEKLCPFLNLPVKDAKFPHENKSAQT